MGSWMGFGPKKSILAQFWPPKRCHFGPFYIQNGPNGIQKRPKNAIFSQKFFLLQNTSQRVLDGFWASKTHNNVSMTPKWVPKTPISHTKWAKMATKHPFFSKKIFYHTKLLKMAKNHFLGISRAIWGGHGQYLYTYIWFLRWPDRSEMVRNPNWTIWTTFGATQDPCGQGVRKPPKWDPKTAQKRDFFAKFFFAPKHFPKGPGWFLTLRNP